MSDGFSGAGREKGVAESGHINTLKTVAFCSGDPRGVEGPRGGRHPAPPGRPCWVCSAPEQLCLRWEGRPARRPAFRSCGSSVPTGYSPPWEGPVARGHGQWHHGGVSARLPWLVLSLNPPLPSSWEAFSPGQTVVGHLLLSSETGFGAPATPLGHCVPVCGTAGPAGASSDFLEGVC